MDLRSMNDNKILIIGYFGYETNQLDGQTVKTRNIYQLLESKMSIIGGCIDFFDTQSIKYKKYNIIVLLKKVLSCHKVVYLPAQNNLTYFFPILYILSKIKRFSILYIVIGGWLSEYLENKPIHKYFLKHIDGIFTETNDLRNCLIQKYHFSNVITFPNFRIHSFVPSFIENNDAFKIIFMARITLSKGIDIIFTLGDYFEKNPPGEKPIYIDLYGPIDKNNEEYFWNKIKEHPNIKYKGVLEPSEIYTVASQYDLLILPTRYQGEGFPGTIMDAYISGIPVIASNWKSIPEFIDVNKTGFVFNLGQENDLYSLVIHLYDNPKLLKQMKQNAYQKSKEYSAEKAWEILKPYLLKEKS